MKKYSSYADFQSQNAEAFTLVLQGKTKLKSFSELAMSGSALTEAENLSYEFLNLSNTISDLMFGLSSSVLDAKAKLKEVEGVFFRDSPKSAADKAKLVQAEPSYVMANQIFNDLTDLQEYLQNKKKDAETAYYHYRGIYQGK